MAGFCLVAFPLTGTLTLTVFVVAWFLATGALLGVAAYEQRGRPGFGWIALHAVVSLILGVLIALETPDPLHGRSACWSA